MQFLRKFFKKCQGNDPAKLGLLAFFGMLVLLWTLSVLGGFVARKIEEEIALGIKPTPKILFIPIEKLQISQNWGIERITCNTWAWMITDSERVFFEARWVQVALIKGWSSVCTLVFPFWMKIRDLKGIHFLQKMKCQWQESGKARIVFWQPKKTELR